MTETDDRNKDDYRNFFSVDYDPYKLPGEVVPIPMALKAIMYCSYGSTIRCALKLMFYTGCRISELNHMYWEKKKDYFISWRCGKNQHGKWREEFLPPDFWQELDHHRRTNKTLGGRLLAATGESIIRYFNKEIRPYLGVEWNTKSEYAKDNGFEKEYIYQLKAYRKIFQTLLLQHYWEYYKSVDVAGEHVSARMRHSNSGINWRHYLRMAKELHAERYVNMMPFKILKQRTPEKDF